MLRLLDFKKKKNILLLLVGVILIILLSIYFLSQKSHFVTKNDNQLKLEQYSSPKGFSLEYPGSYEVGALTDDTSLFLNKDRVSEGDEYELIKGVSMIITFYNNKLNDEFVNKDNKFIIENSRDEKIVKKTINGHEAVELTTSYDSDLQKPSLIKVYLANNSNTLSISFHTGRDITEEEYNQYLEELNSLTNSVRFQE